MLSLPTLKTLHLPDYSAYDAERRAFLQREFGQEYLSLDDHSSWNQVAGRFSRLLESDDDIEHFNVFWERRSAALQSHFVAPLGQIRAYFENYLFLLTTTHPDYALSAEQRKKLKERILEPIRGSVCETGILTHFEEALYEYGHANDWIGFGLHVYRHNAIRILAETFNQLYNINVALSIHVIAHMKRRAKSIGIGLSFQDEVADAHLTDELKEVINTYFDQQIHDVLHRYHQEMVPNLTQFVLQELHMGLSAYVDPQALLRWETTPLALGDEALNRLPVVLAKYFPGLSPMDLMQDGEYNQLQPKPQLLQQLRGFVERKLLDNEYLARLEDIREDKVARGNIWCPIGVDLNVLLNCSGDQVFFLPQVILNAYPRLLEEAVKPYRRGQPIPLSLRKSPVFLRQLVKQMGQDWLDAEKHTEGAQWQSCVKTLLTISDIDRAYLIDLPNALWRDECFAQALMCHDRDLVTLFDSSIHHLLVDASPFGEHLSPVSLSSQLEAVGIRSPSLQASLAAVDLSTKFDAVYLLHRIVLLLDKRYLSPFQWISFCKSISPVLLSDILQYRQDHFYPAPAIPIDEALWSTFLQAYPRSLGHRSYLEVRDEVLERLSSPEQNLQAQRRMQLFNSLLGTENWVLALLSYPLSDQDFLPPLGPDYGVWRSLRQGLKAVAKLMHGVGKNLLWLMAKGVAISTVGVLATLLALDIAIFSILVPFFCGDALVSCLCGEAISDVSMVFVALGLLRIIWNRFAPNWRESLEREILELISFIISPLQWNESVVGPWQEMKASFKRFVSGVNQMRLAVAEERLSEEVKFVFAVESLILQGLSSEQENTEHHQALYVLWQNILKDAGEAPDLAVFRRLIHVPYPLYLHDETQQLSFWQVANANYRACQVASRASSARFSFFSAKEEPRLVRLLKEYGVGAPPLLIEASPVSPQFG